MYWDNDLGAFYMKKPDTSNLSQAERFHNIREAVKKELGMILKLKFHVEWVNVDEKTREDIIEMFP